MKGMLAIAVLLIVPAYIGAARLDVLGYRPHSDGCCMADTWHGIILMTLTTPSNGTLTVNQFSGMMNNDWNRKRQRMDITGTIKPGNYPYKATVFNDFLKKEQYTLLPDGSCTKQPLQYDMFPLCIPDGFKKEGHVSLGYGKNKAEADLWLGNTGGFDLAMTVTEGCTPVTQSVSMTLKGAVIFELGTMYSDVVQGSLSQPGILEIPEKCLQ